MKIILSNIYNNEIIPDENFPDYSTFKDYLVNRDYLTDLRDKP